MNLVILSGASSITPASGVSNITSSGSTLQASGVLGPLPQSANIMVASSGSRLHCIGTVSNSVQAFTPELSAEFTVI